jgi:hypothetical protein
MKKSNSYCKIYKELSGSLPNNLGYFDSCLLQGESKFFKLDSEVYNITKIPLTIGICGTKACSSQMILSKINPIFEGFGKNLSKT